MAGFHPPGDTESAPPGPGNAEPKPVPPSRQKSELHFQRSWPLESGFHNDGDPEKLRLARSHERLSHRIEREHAQDQADGERPRVP